jgi:arylsulfatase A-like enzyme
LLTGDGDHISHVSRSGNADWYHNETIEMEDGYSSQLITRHSIDFMRKNRGKPFFLYVAHLVIHFPWQAPGEKAHRVVGEDYWSLEKLGPHPEGHVAPVVQAMIEALDASVGEIMAAIRELRLDENTLVFFTSDNGGYLDYAGKFQGELSTNGPCRGQKTDIWEGGHREPAIAWWPGRIKAGTTTPETAMTMDILPTYAELAGLNAPADVDGITLTPLFFEDEPLPKRDLFWRAGRDYAVRRGPWKLVGDGGKVHLFNLDDDIGERQDVSVQHPALVEDLLASLKAWEQDVDAR